MFAIPDQNNYPIIFFLLILFDFGFNFGRVPRGICPHCRKNEIVLHEAKGEKGEIKPPEVCHAAMLLITTAKDQLIVKEIHE